MLFWICICSEVCPHHTGQGHQAKLLRIICCLLLSVCFESLNVPDTTCSRTIAGRIYSDELRIGLYSPLCWKYETLCKSALPWLLLGGRLFIHFLVCHWKVSSLLYSVFWITVWFHVIFPSVKGDFFFFFPPVLHYQADYTEQFLYNWSPAKSAAQTAV